MSMTYPMLTTHVINTHYLRTQTPVLKKLYCSKKMMVNKTSSKFSPEYDMINLKTNSDLPKLLSFQDVTDGVPDFLFRCDSLY